ncbi:RtcB family protein [Salinicoccus halitifaciens]|uniref:3'-phosphate/5'-hydroxy nucleic acid ligase n=1 Tax=Salinicoccus halitifaciens TaxID=1073415 RepID=A0ABV2E6Z8_9STAP|nr:RtcB family protein [Salinicoccus halitifaciens]MCD2136751.1 RtcB family protein [Salinicoccus halitifaciens]
MEIQGKNGVAKAFIETIEENTVEQIKKMLDSDITENAKVRIMPDVHYGKGSTIGTTIRLPESKNDWKVSPNVVGVDIGCGMMSYKLADFNIPLEQFDKLVGSKVPSGKGVHAQPNSDPEEWTRNLTMPLSDKEKEYINRSLGTLGGGNHFIELAVDENGDHWLTVHSGSRKLGHMIATYHQKVADFTRNNAENEALLQSLKEKGHYEEIHKLLNPGKKKRKRVDDLAYLEGDLLADYINDMAIAQQFAHANRKAMLDEMIEAAGLESVDAFDSIHNFIDIENGIIRKGATSAREGERLIIPLNMRDGSLICAGKGNPDWNHSAPHGAGRVMSRTQASKTIDVKAFMDSMKGVYSSSVGQKTVDESPFVYKAAEDIIFRIGDTVEIHHWIKPVYNFKAK